MNIKCFLIESAELYRLTFRRYGKYGKPENVCKGPYGTHDAQIFWGHVATDTYDFDNERIWIRDLKDRFPVKCETCNYEFAPDDEYQIFKRRLYHRVDKKHSNLFSLEESEVGAIWRAEWYEDNYKGADGKCYVVKTPGGDWIIDSVASNCTMPDDKIHKCWVREGEAPNFTVGKTGYTCAAGAGSILINNYHGFLHGGELVGC